jgi:hypothetical protein
VATIMVAVMYMACVDRQPSRVAQGSAAEPSSEPVLSDDRVCEMWIAHNIRELTDLWARRYAVTVSCMSTKESAEAAGYHWSGEGEITVTVTLANAQDVFRALTETPLRASIPVTWRAARSMSHPLARLGFGARQW